MKLTPQETRVFKLLFEDISIKEIAARLELSDSTVSTYIKNIGIKYDKELRPGVLTAAWVEGTGITLGELFKRLGIDS